MYSKILVTLLIGFTVLGHSFCQVNESDNTETKIYEISKSDKEWKSILSPDEFDVLRKKGTEYAFTGEYYVFKEKGTYTCAGCGNELFDSKTKYNSGSGWPSFYQPIKESAVHIEIDRSLGGAREEILCSKCGGHLGHVFNDGPKPTGLRYCVNSVSLDFKQK